MVPRALLAVLLVATGCDALGLEGPDQHCGEIDPPYDLLDEKGYAGKVYGGTVEPTVMPLAPGQLPAIGSLGRCSGTLVAQRWVLTAAHCQVAPGDVFCMGEQHDRLDVCIPTARVVAHPIVDVALIELVDDAERWMRGVQPIPVVDEILGCERLGEMAEAAGYGSSPNVSFGVRFFTAEPIIGLTHDYVTLHGLGRKGMCRGDSGAPVMVVASDGSVRVAGALNGGDASCRGRDDFARVDVMQGWIGGFVGSAALPGGSRF